MTDTPTKTDAPAQTLASDVEAELVWTSTNRPPEVTLSFQGLSEPMELWDKLRSIGWTVPLCPPRPGSAIEWVPDPVAGTDYTILPWRVKEFRLQEGEWSSDSINAIGVRTVRALQRYDAKIDGLPPHLEVPAEANPVAVEPDPVRQTLHAAAAPGVAQSAPDAAQPTEQEAAPEVNKPAFTRVIIFDNAEDRDEAIPGFRSWPGMTGREQVASEWSESPYERSVLFRDKGQLEGLFSRGGRAWMLDESSPLPLFSKGSIGEIRMIIPDMNAAESQFGKLKTLLGDDLVPLSLVPVDPAVHAEAVLICAAVDSTSAELLRSNLRLRVPRAVLRVES
ncbi:MAG: hypothetical protein ACI81L_002431 [Verrucomicrobiales bacterium]|jgi:hypothetical protein